MADPHARETAEGVAAILAVLALGGLYSACYPAMPEPSAFTRYVVTAVRGDTIEADRTDDTRPPFRVITRDTTHAGAVLMACADGDQYYLCTDERRVIGQMR